jgi:glyoxylase-like metal-dependent hydrolase (beta-lactamase superfamily II)
MLEHVETKIDNPMLNDMAVAVSFTGYKDYGGVKFPSHIVQQQGGFPVLEVDINDVKPNAPVSIAAAGERGPEGGQPGTVGRLPSEKLADGVFLITGAGAASVAIDFGNYILVVEGPAGDQRAEAVIAEAKQLLPNKLIRYVVNTHQHFDHSSGLRAFVAEGATIVTQQVNKPYLEKILAAPRNYNAALNAKNKGALKVSVDPVAEKKVMTGGGHTLELYHLRGNMHNAGIIIAYLPKQKMLIQADMWGPPPPNQGNPPVSTYTQNFLENMDRLQLQVDRVIPIHYPGRVTTWTDVIRTTGH